MVEGDILVDFLSGSDEARLILDRAADEGLICVSAMTCAEILASAKGGRFESASEFLSSFKVIPVNWEVAQNAGTWFVDDAGSKFDLSSCIVAATVLELGAVLVTKGERSYPDGDYEVRVEKY